MEFYTFMKTVEEKISQMNMEEISSWVYGYARTLEQSKREEFIESFSSIKKEIHFSKDEFEQFLMKIEDEDIYFEAKNDYYYNEFMHDYEDEVEYIDSFSIIPQLTKYINIAYHYLYNKDYKQAYEILSKLSEIEFFVKDEEYGDSCYYTIIDLYDNDILHIDIQEYKKTYLYILLQVNESNQNLYKAFNDMKTVVLSDVFSFGPEAIENSDTFALQWIDFLKTIEGDMAIKLLYDGCQYLTNEQLLELARENYQIHPSLYQLCCLKAFESKDIETGRNIALEAIKVIPIHYQIRSEIANLAIQYCSDPYFYEIAFLSNPTSFHCLRLYSQDIDIQRIKKEFKAIDYSMNQYENHELKTAYLTNNNIELYLFLLGDYEKSIQGTQTKFLNLLLMLLKPEDHSYQADINLLSTIESHLYYKTQDQHDFQDYFKLFKNKYHFSLKFKNECILWLQNQVSIEAENIVGGGERHYYHYVADQIVVLAQILKKEGLIESVYSYVDMYKKEYTLKRAFKTEINERMVMIS